MREYCEKGLFGRRTELVTVLVWSIIEVMNAILVIAGVERSIASDLSPRDIRVYLDTLGHGPGTLWRRSARVSFDTDEKITPGGRYVFLPLHKSPTMTAVLVFDGITKEETISTPRSLIQFMEAMIDLRSGDSAKEGDHFNSMKTEVKSVLHNAQFHYCYFVFLTGHRKGKDAQHIAEIMVAVWDGYTSFTVGTAEEQIFAERLPKRIACLPRALRYQAIGLFGSALTTPAARHRARTQLEIFENEVKRAKSAKELKTRAWEEIYRAGNSDVSPRPTLVRFNTCA